MRMTMAAVKRLAAINPKVADALAAQSEKPKRRGRRSLAAINEGSALEARFAALVAESGLPKPVRELRFAPPRRWRFDFAFPDHLVAVEIEGGIYSGGRHTRGKGYEADCEKYNQAVAAGGWRVLRFTAGMLRDSPERCVEQVRKLIGG